MWTIEFDDVGAILTMPTLTRYIRWTSVTEHSYSFAETNDNSIERFILNRVTGTFVRTVIYDREFYESIFDCKKTDSLKRKF